MDELQTGELIARWRLVGELGAGSYGTVWAVEDTDPVDLGSGALKLLGTEDSLREEIRRLDRLRHENLVAYRDSGRLADRRWWVVTERCEASLADVLAARGALTSDEVRELAGDLLAGVAYLHGQNVLHRDLKPGNILLHEGRWKVADFGESRDLVGSRHEMTAVAGPHARYGTIPYLSPESFDRDELPSMRCLGRGRHRSRGAHGKSTAPRCDCHRADREHSGRAIPVRHDDVDDQASLSFHDVTDPATSAPPQVNVERCAWSMLIPASVPEGTTATIGECPGYEATVLVPGDRLEYRLELLSGQVVAVVGDGGYDMNLTVLDPSGTTVAIDDGSGFGSTVTATVGGVHTFTLAVGDNSAGAAGSLAFYDISEPPQVPPPSTTTDRCARQPHEPALVPTLTKSVPGACPAYGASIALPGQTLRFSLDLTEGQRIGVTGEAGFGMATSALGPDDVPIYSGDSSDPSFLILATTTGRYQIDLVSTDETVGDEVSLGFYDVTVPTAMAPPAVDRTRCPRTLIEPVTVPVGTKVVPGECPSYGSTIGVPGEVLEHPLDMVAGQSLEIVPDAGYGVEMSVIDPTGQVIAASDGSSSETVVTATVAGRHLVRFEAPEAETGGEVTVAFLEPLPEDG